MVFRAAENSGRHVKTVGIISRESGRRLVERRFTARLKYNLFLRRHRADKP
jgi:hypothetical protein